MASTRTSLYREFLTPALHRRFTSAAVVILVVCYVEAILTGEASAGGDPLVLVSNRPSGHPNTFTLHIGAFDLRTKGCSAPRGYGWKHETCVAVALNVGIGSRTTASPFETFTKYLLRANTTQTLVWYTFSAWWFSEVYMWSVPSSADLGWISEGRPWEPRKLNEKPIYLRSMFFMLAAWQSALHLYYDYDKITLPATQSKESTTEQPSNKQSPLFALRDLTPSLGKSIGIRAACMSIFGPLIYTGFIRSKAWSWSLYFAALFWDIPNSQLSYTPPYLSVIIRSYVSSVLLITLWEISNVVFSAHVAQEPLKKEQPLTSESKDPNGSLLIGLKMEREVPRSFAFWELAYISQRFEARRKAIFSDIDRKDGFAWNQIMTLSLGEVLGISNRIAEYQHPTPKTAPQITIETLPRISSTDIRQDNIFRNPQAPSTRREMIESNVGTIAKSYGQAPQPPKPMETIGHLRTSTAGYLNTAQQKLLTQGQQETFSKSGLLALFNDYLMRFLRSPVGYPFRRTLKRRICTVVLGTPYSALHPIIDSITALSTLAQASIKEDPYGIVAKDVPLLIRAFVSTISTIEAFVRDLQPHWTDVDFSESDRKVEEVELVVETLKSGLKDIVGAFGMYAAELGITAEEMRTAKAVAGMEGYE